MRRLCGSASPHVVRSRGTQDNEGILRSHPPFASLESAPGRLLAIAHGSAGEPRLFEDVGTSYEWNTFISGRKIDRATMNVVGVEVWPPLLGDGEDFHGRRGRNYLYSDGRVTASKNLEIE